MPQVIMSGRLPVLEVEVEGALHLKVGHHLGPRRDQLEQVFSNEI